MIKVRELTINDVESLICLLEQLWIGKQIDLIAVKRIIEKGLNNDYQVYICATDNEKLVGYCSLTIKNNLWMLANLGNVDELVVDSEYRNQGIGKMLMCEIEKIAREHECKLAFSARQKPVSFQLIFLPVFLARFSHLLIEIKPQNNKKPKFYLSKIFFYLCTVFKKDKELGKFDTYKVDLKGMQEDVQEYEYLLDNQFFINIGGEDVQKGRVKVSLTVNRRKGFFDFAFVLSGIVIVPCDRCLDDMDFPIETAARLVVKFGKDYAEESDEIVVIPESEGIINLAWFLYEFVALAIPIKHIHAPGKCNKQMTSKLKKHSAKSGEDDDPFDGDIDDIIIAGDDDSRDTDPRWGALKEIKEEN